MGATLRLSRGARAGSSGLFPLTLARVVNGQEKGKLTVFSGSPSRQVFRRAGDPDSLSGSREPIPEGVYDLGAPEWAGRVGDYSASWGPGLGAFWVSILARTPMQRGDFGIHEDANRSTAPGSLGCVVAPDRAALETIVSWWNTVARDAPTELHVDWGLGTFPAPPQTIWAKVFLHAGRARGYVGGKEVPELELVQRLANGRLHVLVNGKEIKPASVNCQVEQAA